jgi:haloalkane dehalogenase
LGTERDDTSKPARGAADHEPRAAGPDGGARSAGEREQPPSPRPGWLDADAYPFASHFLDLGVGRLHYVDEGSGPPIVMVHGQPDLLGFGLSDKPQDWAYRAPQHAACVARLIEHLGLRDVTLLVHDWGGPIGLSYAIDRPDNVARVVLLNTWMWSLDREWVARLFSGALGSAAGRWATRRFDLFVRQLMKRALHHLEEGRYWKRVARYYEGPFARPDDRIGCSVFPREVLAASGWLRGLWDRRARLASKPALLVWGMRDFAFREEALQRWLPVFPQHRVSRQEQVGHYVAEEMGEKLAPLVESFIADTPTTPRRPR